MDAQQSGDLPEPAAQPPERSRRALTIKRLLPLLIVAVLATWFFRGAPEPTELVYGLGPRSQGLEQLAVELYELPDRSLVRRAEFHYSPSSPAPAEQPQALKLETDSSYVIEATFVYPDRRETLSREFTFHGEARITVRL